jgi:hypothetical protein
MQHKVIGHIIGLDEIHKKKLIKDLANSMSHLKIIDLDIFQQMIYNHKDTLKQKTLWTDISKEINTLQRQKRLVRSKTNKLKPLNLQNKLNKALAKRNQIKKTIHSIWKQMMLKKIDQEMMNLTNDRHILFVGFNIFPKDFRIRIALPLPEQSTTTAPSRIMFDIKSGMYAMNQIKYYLNTYSERIVKGTFPLNLLKNSYLEEKYDKIINHYHQYNYRLVGPSELCESIQTLDQTLDKQSRMAQQIETKPLYIVTMYKSTDLIPVNVGKPLPVYRTKEEALDAIKPNLKNNKPVYVYQIPPTNVQLVDDKLVLKVAEKPINEESVLLTI